MPQFGVLSRSPVGLLVWYGNEDNAKNNVNQQHPGSRLKTPAMPIWVSSVVVAKVHLRYFFKLSYIPHFAPC